MCVSSKTHRNGFKTGRAVVCALAAALCFVPFAAQSQGPVSDLAATIENGMTYVAPAQHVVYVITVANLGPDDAVAVPVTAVFGAALTDVAWVAVPENGAVSSGGTGTGNISDVADLPAGAMIAYAVAAIVDAAASPGVLSSTATVEPPAGTTDPHPANNTATDVDDIEPAQTIARNRPVFENTWPSPNALLQPDPPASDNAVAAYNGHVGDWSAPAGETAPRFVLKTSSFGQPLGSGKASPVMVADTMDRVYGQLFCLAGDPSGQNNDAAFRFLNTLYQQQPPKDGTVGEIMRRLDNHLTYDYTVDPNDGVVSDEERALESAQEIVAGLQQDPGSGDLRNLLLDIYYYRTVGRQIAAKDKVVEAYEIDFSSVVSSDASFGTPINAEIDAFKAAADALSGVLDPYRELLAADMGIDVTDVDPDYHGNLPFGYYLFINEVPYRSMYAPTFTGYDDQTGEVSGDPVPVDPGDTVAIPLLYVTRTALNVDEAGNSKDVGVLLQFQVRNYGLAPLPWQATVKNPEGPIDSATGLPTEVDMVSIRKDNWGWRTLVTSGNTPLAPGASVTVTVQVKANTATPLRRTAVIEVRDTSGGADALSYDVTVLQDGCSKPILEVSPHTITLQYLDFLNEFGTGVFYSERRIFVRNAGMGTVDWRASVWMSNLNGFLTFRNPDLYLDLYQSSVSGTNAGVITAIVWLPTLDWVGLIEEGGEIFSWVGVDVVNATTSLSAGINASVTTIPVVSTADFSASGAITIGDYTDAETITYTAKTATTFTGCTRGTTSTTAKPHLINTVVTQYNPVFGDNVYIGYAGAKMYPGPSKFLPEDALLLSVYPQETTFGSYPAEDVLFIENAASLTDLQLTTSDPWLHVSSTVSEEGLATWSIDANPDPVPRTGTIVVSASNSVPESVTMTVTQDGRIVQGLSVTPAQRFVRQVAGQAEAAAPDVPGTGFTITPVGSRTDEGDILWTAQVVQGQEWLSIVSGETGADAGEVLFAYDTNPSISGRTAEILIESPNAMAGQNSFTVRVTQRGSVGAPVLTGGFKDLALIFNVLRDDAQVNKELAKRYALRRTGTDLDTAYALIDETTARHNALLADIGGLIPGWQKSVEPNSELVAAYSSWQQAVEELATVRDFLDGGTNILGFAEDFLFLVQAFQGQPPDLFDSFDKLFTYMFDGENNTAVLASPLGQAYDKFLTARAQYENFVVTQDQLAEELRTQNLEHRKWMYDVVGADPGNDPDNPDDPDSYHNPSGNYGGEIWMIDRSIDRARQAVLKNRAEIKRIEDEIQTELWRRSQETQINTTIGNLHVAYGDQVATIEGVIGVINGTEEFTRNIAEAFNVESVGAGLLFKPLNGVYCAVMEAEKGQLEAEKARLAAMENCEVGQLEDQILDVNSKALIQNLMGEIAVLGVEAADLGLGLITSFASRQANIDEWHYREARMRENNAALLGRSFADPIHRLRMRRAMVEAEATFKVAQRWVFFAIRALEYKWNVPFSFSSATGNWSLDSLFRARTAKDLIDLMAAIRDFDGLMQGSARFDDRFDWFSFKKDFMGYTPVYDLDGVTELPTCSHPDTGLAVTATEAFHARLQKGYDPDTGTIEMPFSTFHDNGQTFFRGPRRSASDPTVVLSRGQYLDKIDWILINVQGDFSGAPEERVSGALTYSGGCYLRNARVGTIPDPSRPDVIDGEFTYWPTKFWFFDSGVPDATPPIPGGWRWSDEQTTEVSLSLVEDVGIQVPDSVARIDVFRERSVACDGWLLRIFTQNLDGEAIISPDQIEDIEIQFYHMSKDRPDIPVKIGDDAEAAGGAE